MRKPRGKPRRTFIPLLVSYTPLRIEFLHFVNRPSMMKVSNRAVRKKNYSGIAFTYLFSILFIGLKAYLLNMKAEYANVRIPDGDDDWSRFDFSYIANFIFFTREYVKFWCSILLIKKYGNVLGAFRGRSTQMTSHILQKGALCCFCDIHRFTSFFFF